MRNLLIFRYDVIAKVWSNVKKILIPRGSSTESWIIIVSWIVLISIDPLFFYFFVINDEKKSLEVNKKVATVLWSINVLFYLYRLVILFQNFRKRRPVNFVEHLANTPTTWAPYLLLESMTRKDSLAFSIGMTLALSMYLLRVFGIYSFFAKQVTTISSKPAKATGIRIVLNLVLYLCGGHLFRALWYFSTVWKRMECWNEECSNHHGCYYARLGFHVTWGDNKFLHSTCPMNDKLGIVEEAFEIGIMEVKDLPKKWLYCFRWGLQNLSNFGQSLKVGIHYWENIFVIFLALYGMVTFTFFIGNMQNLVEQKRRKEEEIRREEEEMRRKQKKMEQWLPFKMLSKELQNSIKEYKQYKWQQTECVSVENFLNNLPIDLQKSVKRDICLQILKKTEEFKRWSEASLIHICDCIKPMLYAEHTRIINKGDPIFEMHFVVQGSCWGHCSWSSTNNVPQESYHLTYRDYWGEELVSWAQSEQSISTIPTSNKTIHSRTKVEALVITAVDLKNIFVKHNQRAQVIQSYFRRRRMRALRRNAQTSTQEQAPAAELSGLEIVVVQE